MPPPEAALWRRAYCLGRGQIVQVDAGRIALPVAGIGAVPVELRIHPVGVVAVRFWIGSDGVDLLGAYDLNNRLAAWRDEAGERYFDAEPSDDEITILVTRLQDAAAPFLEPRPRLVRRNALNTLQAVRVAPRMGDPETVRWIDQFGRVQGAPLGPDGRVVTSPHTRAAWWEDAAIVHLGGGQTLALTESTRHLADIVSAYERAHVLRFWLRTWIDVLDAVGASAPRTRRLDRDDVRALSLEHLRLTDLHNNVTRSLAEVDDRNIPASSIFGRQLTVTLTAAFAVDDWKASVLHRLEAAATRNAYIGTVLEREFQLSAQRQNEKLQLLFAGSLAATIMALLPALLALIRPREPLWPWIVTTVAGTVLIWVVTVYLVVARWKVEVLLPDDDRR